MFKLYFKGNFLSQHDTFEDAEAASRWTHFEYRSHPWEGFQMPPGFMIVIEGLKDEQAA